MKKILSIIGAIGLTATSTTTLISCKTENNNKNDKDNKPITPKTQEIKQTQKPPKGSNWKLIDINSSIWISNKEFSNNKNKWYIMFAKKRNTNNFDFIKFKNNDINNLWSLGNQGSFNISLKGEWYWFNWLYCWDGDGEPKTPTIDKNTGEITDWKEQKGTK